MNCRTKLMLVLGDPRYARPLGDSSKPPDIETEDGDSRLMELRFI